MFPTLAANQAFRPTSNYRMNSNLTQRDEGTLYFHTLNVNYTLHPSHLAEILSFNKESKKHRLEEAIDVKVYTIPSSVQQLKMTSGAKGKGRHGKKAANDGLWDADAPHYVEGMQQ
ncbi:hypothetical protein C0991_007304 [Blastosporella zonata]|nr:hypothetical protein C0991_007304 [Blastosporella zonata]